MVDTVGAMGDDRTRFHSAALPTMSTPLRPDDSPSNADPPSANVIRDWLVARVSAVQGVDASEIRTDEPLMALGFDSMQLVVLVGELEQWLGCRFTENPLVDHPTIDALATWLAAQLAAGTTRIDPTKP